MIKTKRLHGMVTFYLKPMYRKDFEIFQYLIERDSRLIELRAKAKYGLTSIALIQLMLKYIDENIDKLPDKIKSDYLSNIEESEDTEEEEENETN